MNSIPRDTLWRPLPVAAGRYRPWLTDRGSLTARIARRCPGVRVELLFQGLRKPDRDERLFFPDRAGSRVLVREVMLRCGDTPLVFAHTILDPADLHGSWRSVATQGVRPLGAALFSDPRIERHALRVKKVEWHHELHRRVTMCVPAVPRALWARRSLFRRDRAPMLVTEVFLPEVLAL